MSSLKALQTRRVAPKTHSLVYEIKEACWWLKNNGYEIQMMWIPSYVGIRSNERNQLAGDAVENRMECHAAVCLSDLLFLSRIRLLEGWQPSSWDGSDMGRFAYSIRPVVSFMTWFSRFERVIISMINRMMANHSCLKSHQGRIGIVESPMCVCSRNYETVNHVLWCSERFDTKRLQLWMNHKAILAIQWY
jgi:hypothetical protein